MAFGFAGGDRHGHPGQGTASTGIFFENAYLEFIWLEDPAAAESELIRRTHLRERTDLGCAANRFGVGLRTSAGGAQSAPFATWDYRPPYLPAGASIPMALNSGCLEEPLLFVLPWKCGPGYAAPDHPNGARRITSVTLELAGVRQFSRELEAFAALQVVHVRHSRESLARVELDRARRKESADLRPAVPLVVRW